MSIAIALAMADSSLINAGTPGAGPSIDLLGRPAPRGAAPDIGAVELQP
jgi:hypothetical protein